MSYQIRVFCQRLISLKFFLFQKTYWHSKLFTHAKTSHRVFTAVIDRDSVTSRLIYDNKIFCTTLFWCSLKRPSVKLTKLLVRCLNAPWKSFYVNLAFEQHSESSSAVTLLLHADWMMVKNASNQPGANSVTVARNPGRECWSLWKLYFWKIIWQ